MRLVVPLALLIFGLGLLAAKLPAPDPSLEQNATGAAEVDDWRRTANGWERMRDWRPAFEQRQPALHPAVVVLLQVLLMLTAMLTFSTVPRRFPVGSTSSKTVEQGSRAEEPSAKVNQDLRSSQRRVE